jgi:large conductance mechanosensitive channel
MLKEFREFIARGNVVDLAVGVIIGAAFGKIVTSLVDDLMMPPIGKLLAGVDFTNLFISLSGGTYKTLPEAEAAGAATINYGVFLNAVVQFFIVAFVIFLMVRSVNKLKGKEEKVDAEPAPSKEEILLAEIRDILKAQR